MTTPELPHTAPEIKPPLAPSSRTEDKGHGWPEKLTTDQQKILRSYRGDALRWEDLPDAVKNRLRNKGFSDGLIRYLEGFLSDRRHFPKRLWKKP